MFAPPDDERELDGMSDEDLLALGTAETPPTSPGSSAGGPRRGRTHSGCAIVVGIDHGELGTIIRVIQQALAARPEPEDRRDHTCFRS